MITTIVQAYLSGFMVYSNEENRDIPIAEVEQELRGYGVRFDKITITTTLTNG
jgi:hypothetical protein